MKFFCLWCHILITGNFEATKDFNLYLILKLDKYLIMKSVCIDVQLKTVC